jgi:GT2 family glycosyltransferase/nucleoside-diphosphate-sugar epimerase
MGKLDSNRPPVSVVVVNHNAGSALLECLASIAGQACEVVVVDNGSQAREIDGILEQAERFGGEVRLVLSPVNTGFARACNLGIGRCGGEAVLLLNPDCIAPPGLVERLWEVLCKNPRAGMVGPLLQNPDGSEQRGGRRLVPTPGRALAEAFFFRAPSSSADGFNQCGQPLPAGPVAVEAISGACMLLRRTALENAGAMDEGFFLHCEDLDLCVRFRNRGWVVLFDPLSRVVHSKGVCSRRRPLAVEWHKHCGMVRFYRKHFREKYPAPLGSLVSLGVWLRFVGVALLSPFRKTIEPSAEKRSARLLEPDASPPDAPTTGVLGASSFVGRVLLPLLLRQGRSIRAISRRERISRRPDLVWSSVENLDGEIADWVSLCPLPALVKSLPRLAACGARRLVAISSTSRFTKLDSPDPRERRLAEDLAAAEEKILQWAAEAKVEAVVLRPTLVYDGVEDANIAAISRFIRRWGWFPVCGPSSGLRQPLHAFDLARACAAALASPVPTGTFDLSGGETISYRAMIERIFEWENRRPRIVAVPAWLVRGIVPVLRCLPGFRRLSVQVFERMNANLVFDHSAAAEAFGFAPQGFEPPTGREISC